MSVPLAQLRRQAQVVWLHDRLGAPRPAPPPSATPQPSPSAEAPATHPAAHPIAHPATSSPAPGAAPSAPAFRMMGGPPAAPTPAAVQSHSDARLMDVSQGTRRDFVHADAAEHYLRFWQHDAGALRELRQALQRLEPSSWVFTHTDARVVALLAAHMAQGSVVVTESAQPAQPAGLPGVPAPPATPAAPLAMTVAPIKPPVLPILPILEEVQIEGAEVLPEIMQSLEQIDITLGEIKIAPVSLAPTPSKIPEIESAMTAASGSVTNTLDKL